MLHDVIRYGSASLLVAICLACLPLKTDATDEESPAKPKKALAEHAAQSLEGLLKKTKIEYTRHKDHDVELFKIPVELGGETTMVYAQERRLGQTKDGVDITLVYLWATITTLPKDFKPPLAMLKKVMKLNDKLLVGEVDMDDRAIFYSSSFWLRTADPQILLVHLLLTHEIRLSGRQELVPFLRD